MIRQTKPGLVALYDIRPGNGAGPFLQPRSPHGDRALRTSVIKEEIVIICRCRPGDIQQTCESEVSVGVLHVVPGCLISHTQTVPSVQPLHANKHHCYYHQHLSITRLISSTAVHTPFCWPFCPLNVSFSEYFSRVCILLG